LDKRHGQNYKTFHVICKHYEIYKITFCKWQTKMIYIQNKCFNKNWKHNEFSMKLLIENSYLKMKDMEKQILYWA
jgi:hypothetical protein